MTSFNLAVMGTWSVFQVSARAAENGPWVAIVEKDLCTCLNRNCIPCTQVMETTLGTNRLGNKAQVSDLDRGREGA